MSKPGATAIVVLLVALLGAFGTHYACGSSSHPKTVVVETKYGKVEGEVIRSSETDVLVVAYKGIPYGKAQRFQKPEPVEPWSGILRTQSWGRICHQHQIFGKFAEAAEGGDGIEKKAGEDCLFLNVFGPHEKGQPLPVLFYIHGGGFAIGSSDELGWEGIVDWVVPKGVIVVTINYRLGPWGFFSTGTEHARGNYGLWDQTLALRWVRDNVRAFGGDPDRVTVVGESAGAISVSMLTVSPHSRDLFHQAIAMSGSSYLPWFTTDEHPNTIRAGHIVSMAMGCGALIPAAEVDARNVLECLRSKSNAQILEALDSYRAFGDFQYVGFVPVDDGDFFPEPIEKLMETVPGKPIISGTVGDEMGMFVTTPFPFDFEWVLEKPESFTIDQLAEKLDYFLPRTQFGQWTPLIHRLALNHYVDSLGDRRNNSFVVQQYKAIFGDFLFGHPAYKEAQQRLRRGSPVWLYSFDYYDQALFPEDYPYKSAHHYFEMPYLFKGPPVYHPSPFEGNDKFIKDLMTTLWTNFAIYGHPNPEESPFRDQFTWDPITRDHPARYLHIGLQPEQRQQYNRRMVSFWHELLPQLLCSLPPTTPAPTHHSIKTEL